MSFVSLSFRLNRSLLDELFEFVDVVFQVADMSSTDMREGGRFDRRACEGSVR